MRDTRKARRSGKLFEQFVADLQRLLEGTESARIESPYFVNDLDGTEREVDCGVLFDRGGTRFFVMIECRDRSASNDVTWIEQVKSKREAVQADKAIVVHRMRLSNSAVKAANRANIDVRQLRPVSPETRAFNIQMGGFGRVGCRLVSVQITAPEATAAEREVLYAIEKEKESVEEKLKLSIGMSGPRMTLRGFFEPRTKDPRLVNPDGPPIETVELIARSSPDAELVVWFVGAPAVVDRVIAAVQIMRASVPFEIAGHSEYILDGAAALQADQYVINLPDGQITAAGLLRTEIADGPSALATYQVAFSDPLDVERILEQAMDEIATHTED